MEKTTPAFAAALGRVPSGIFILTMNLPEGSTGMLASWVQQCSFTPPIITVAVRSDRYVAERLTQETIFTLNILDKSQTNMLAHFGKGFDLGEPAFEGVELIPDCGKAPVLSETIAYLDCKVSERFQPGDHVLIAAVVEDGALLNEGEPMVHVRKSGLHY